MPSIENESPSAPRRNKTKLATFIAVGVLAVVFAVMLLATGKVGTVEVTDAGVTKYLSRAVADSQLRIPVTFKEGTDPSHESDHIFPIFEVFSGIEKVTVLADGSAVVVHYVKGEVAPEALTQATAEAGYLAPVK